MRGILVSLVAVAALVCGLGFTSEAAADGNGNLGGGFNRGRSVTRSFNFNRGRNFNFNRGRNFNRGFSFNFNRGVNRGGSGYSRNNLFLLAPPVYQSPPVLLLPNYGGGYGGGSNDCDDDEALLLQLRLRAMGY